MYFLPDITSPKLLIIIPKYNLLQIQRTATQTIKFRAPLLILTLSTFFEALSKHTYFYKH